MSLTRNDPRKPDKLLDIVQVIPEPNEENIIEVLSALKEAVETIAQLRGEIATRAVTFQDLQDLNIVEILPNDSVNNKQPFGVPGSDTLGMFKFCDGVSEDFGQGLGWYFLGDDKQWQFITSIPA